MAIISVNAGCDASSLVNPANLLIDTSDTLQTVMGTGYLNGQTLNPTGFFTSPTFLNGQTASVITTDMGTVDLVIYIDGSSNVNLIPASLSLSNSIMTQPAASSASTLALGTAYQNTDGYDVMLTVYLSITAALTASIVLGVGPTNTPTQQTIVSGLTLAALSIIPVNIYLPSGYYAILDTSGTITLSISGQIAMPI